MKALMKMAPGPGHMEYRDVPVPEIGDDDVLVEVKAAAICGSDMRMRYLGNSEKLRAPVIVGHEAAGMVCAVGKNVTRYRVGDRVVTDNTCEVCGVCDNCAQGDFLHCEARQSMGTGCDGAFTSYFKLSGRLLNVYPHALFPIPDGVSYEEACLMDPITNAYKSLCQETDILPGDDVAVFGMGPIGLLTVQMAAIMGCNRIIAVNRSDNAQRFDIARRFGATHTVCSSREDAVERIQEILGGEKLTVIMDCAGGNEVLAMALPLLKKDGEFVKMGFDAAPVGFSLDHYVNKAIRIRCHFGYDYKSWKNCMRLLQSGKLDVKPLITHRISLDDWETGYELVRSRKGIKVIMTPNPAYKVY